jgi:hypothetical protein
MELFGVPMKEQPSASPRENERASRAEPEVKASASVHEEHDEVDEPSFEQESIEDEEPETVHVTVAVPPPVAAVASRGASEPANETASIPVVTARTAPPREREPVSKGGRGMLAAVLGSNTVTAKPAASRPPVDEIHEEEIHAVAAAPALAVAGRSTPGEQTSFRLGDEDRGGRFKDTEPSLVEGEDMDVPTWMRMRKKLRK